MITYDADDKRPEVGWILAGEVALLPIVSQYVNWNGWGAMSGGNPYRVLEWISIEIVAEGSE